MFVCSTHAPCDKMMVEKLIAAVCTFCSHALLLVLVVASDITDYLLFFWAVLHFCPAVACSTVVTKYLIKKKQLHFCKKINLYIYLTWAATLPLNVCVAT